MVSRRRAEPRGQNTIEGGRCAAALDVPELGHAQLELQTRPVLGEVVGQPLGVVGRALRYDHEGVRLAPGVRVAQLGRTASGSVGTSGMTITSRPGRPGHRTGSPQLRPIVSTRKPRR